MFVVVLNDGETYTDLDGCEVLAVPDSIEDNEVDEYVKERFGTGIPIGEMADPWLDKGKP